MPHFLLSHFVSLYPLSCPLPSSSSFLSWKFIPTVKELFDDEINRVKWDNLQLFSWPSGKLGGGRSQGDGSPHTGETLSVWPTWTCYHFVCVLWSVWKYWPKILLTILSVQVSLFYLKQKQKQRTFLIAYTSWNKIHSLESKLLIIWSLIFLKLLFSIIFSQVTYCEAKACYRLSTLMGSFTLTAVISSLNHFSLLKSSSKISIQKCHLFCAYSQSLIEPQVSFIYSHGTFTNILKLTVIKI